MRENKKFAQVRAGRIAMNLTQEQLADEICVSWQTVNLIENGKYNPSIDLCIKLCKCLDKTLDEIFWNNN